MKNAKNNELVKMLFEAKNEDERDAIIKEAGHRFFCELMRGNVDGEANDYTL